MSSYRNFQWSCIGIVDFLYKVLAIFRRVYSMKHHENFQKNSFNPSLTSNNSSRPQQHRRRSSSICTSDIDRIALKFDVTKKKNIFGESFGEDLTWVFISFSNRRVKRIKISAITVKCIQIQNVSAKYVQRQKS